LQLVNRHKLLYFTVVLVFRYSCALRQLLFRQPPQLIDRLRAVADQFLEILFFDAFLRGVEHFRHFVLEGDQHHVQGVIALVVHELFLRHQVALPEALLLKERFVDCVVKVTRVTTLKILDLDLRVNQVFEELHLSDKRHGLDDLESGPLLQNKSYIFSVAVSQKGCQDDLQTTLVPVLGSAVFEQKRYARFSFLCLVSSLPLTASKLVTLHQKQSFELQVSDTVFILQV